MKQNSLRSLLISSALISLTFLSSTVFAQNTVKDMKAVFTKIPLPTGATSQKPVMVLPICTSRSNLATKILLNDPVAYQLIERGNQILAGNLHAQRIPICTALFEARNIPNVHLFRLDNHHLAADGAYLAACVFYAKLLKRSPIGLPAKVYKGTRLMCKISPGNAKQLQAVAANFVN